ADAIRACRLFFHTGRRGKKNIESCAFLKLQHCFSRRLRGVALHFFAALRAEGRADSREQQPEVIEDFGLSCDGRARISSRVLLSNRNRRTDAGDLVDIGLVHSFEKLSGISGQALDITSLTLGVDSVERETRFTGAAYAGDDGEFVERNIDADVSEVMNSGASNADDFFGHLFLLVVSCLCM